ncbi:MAG: stage V sporulation protein D [Clostridium sp.]|nr:stage V sporulation protein D [Clostridium sp.]MCI7444098.1 stage V sporulation protein D [Clostridium sp.]
MKKKVYTDKALIKNRISISLFILFGLIILLAIRLTYIMIVKHDEYSARAQEQWTSEVKISARRGKVLDTNGVELAMSANVYRVDLDLNSIRKYYKSNIELKKEREKKASSGEKLNEIKGTLYYSNEELAPVLAEAVGMEEEDVLKALNTTLDDGSPAGSATLIRRIEKDVADKVEAIGKDSEGKGTGIIGIIVSPDTKRYYKNSNFLAHVLGTTDADGNGLAGIELEYNTELSGIAGVRMAELDRGGRDLPYTISQYTSPINGSDVTLTIDENIQYFAEKIAETCYQDNQAKAVSVTVMNPKTGEVLAMVNKPDFDPNNPREGVENFEGNTYGDKLQKMWRNRLVNDTFEPGSIFKVMTALAAIEEGIVSDSDVFTCTGSMVVGGRTIRCANVNGHGTQNFADIIKNSCNPGFMQLGEKLGKEKLCEYIKKFGFGSKSGIDLPGEASGIVKAVENISVTDLATISFGQTNTVSSMQYMAAFNAVANGGTWIQPHVMKEISHEDENGTRVIDKTFEPKTRTIATSEQTSELRGYLERVVTLGSGAGTFIEGYHIAGKTGTAQKVENGVYQAGKYISSFVGMAPVDDPKITIMITVDEPGTGLYYAGQVAVPYAKPLFTDIFNYLESKFSSENKNAILRDVIIPEVRGMKVEEAKQALQNVGLTYDISGNGGTVKSITPYPGYSVKEGAKVTLNTETENDGANKVIMPDLSGYSAEKAKNVLDELNIKCEITGSGIVNSQSIPAGELIDKGTIAILELKSEVKD